MAGFNNDTVFAQVGMRIGDKTITTGEKASIQFDESGGDVALLISNTSTDNLSSAYHEIKVPTTNNGLLFQRFRIGNTASWMIGTNAGSPTPTLGIFFSNNGNVSPSVSTNTPFQIDSVVAGGNSRVLLASGEMVLATSAAGNLCRLGLNTGNKVGADAHIQLIQQNGINDAYSTYQMGGSNWAQGVDASASNSWFLTQGAANEWPPTAANITMEVTTGGEVTFPLTPAFLATATGQSNVTGDNTPYNVTFATEIFDQNADFNAATGTFTAPVTGRYPLSTVMSITEIGTGNTYRGRIVTSNTNLGLFSCDPSTFQEGTVSQASLGGSLLFDMDAGDIANVNINVIGTGADTVDVTTESSFSGELCC